MFGGRFIAEPFENRIWGDWQTQWKIHNLKLMIDLNVDPGDVVTIGTCAEFPQIWNEVMAAMVAERGAEPVIIMLGRDKPPQMPTWMEEPAGMFGTMNRPKNFVAALENSELYIVNGGPGLELSDELVPAKSKCRMFGAGIVNNLQECFRHFTMEELVDIRETTFKVCKMVNEGKTFKLITGDGETLTGKFRKAWAVQTDSHRNVYPYTVGMMPTDTGESMNAVVEEESEGTVVIQGYANYMYPLGPITKPLKITLKEGRIVKGPEPEDDEMAQALNARLEVNNDPNNKVLCELGIGTNRYNTEYPLIPSANCEKGNIIKKGIGRVHLGWGENTGIGYWDEVRGKNRASTHFDTTILKPTLYIGDELVIKDGEALF